MVRPEGKNNDQKTLPVVLSDSLCSMSLGYLYVSVFTGILGDSEGLNSI